MNKISVIIPSYNSEDTISRCLNSVLFQAFSDLEIILIDDCSTDNTISKIEQFKEKDRRIKLLRNKSNKGAGYSRNRGLKVATGNYITFIDSDDFISTNTYESINQTIKAAKNPDIVRYRQCSRLYIKNLHINLNFFTNNIYNNQTGIIVPRQNPQYVALETPGVCNKVFNRELIGNTTFPEAKWEDYPFCTFLLGKAKTIAFDPNGRYYYCHPARFNNTTLSDIKKPSSELLDIYDCCDLLEDRYKREGLFDTYEKAIKGNQKIHSLQRTRDIMLSSRYTQEEKRKIINYLINLTTIKYGEIFSDEYYKFMKLKKIFYRTRMEYIEKYYYDGSSQTSLTEEELKEEIKRLIR